MKIIFICGSLEPGRDGVGDYTRRLAGELVRKGHQTSIIALYDKYTLENFFGFQEDAGVSLPILRLKASLIDEERFKIAKDFIKDIQPEWMSLQYVPFAFHPKGLPFRLCKRLVNIGKGRKWHIMFHELWVGMEENAPLKLKWWGRVQRYLIHILIFSLKPCLIHTQTRLYQTQLRILGRQAEYLPLFGNIPVTISPKPNTDFDNDGIHHKKRLSLVLFGAIHKGVPVDQFALELAQYAKIHNIQIQLILLGNNGSEKQNWISSCKRAGLNIKLLGEQSPERISEIFHMASLGISTTPLALIEKSGSAVAMREHGLPVLCVRKNWSVKVISQLNRIPGVIEYRIGELEKCLHNLTRIDIDSSISEVVAIFARDLLNEGQKHGGVLK